MTSESAAFPAQNIAELLSDAAAAEAGGRFRVSITWGPEMTQSPLGPVPVPHWILLVTGTNPADLLGQRLNCMKDLGYGEPTEEMVRAAVREATVALGELARRKLADGQRP